MKDSIALNEGYERIGPQSITLDMFPDLAMARRWDNGVVAALFHDFDDTVLVGWCDFVALLFENDGDLAPTNY